MQTKVLKSNNGIACRVVDMFSIKPIDIQLVAKCARDTGSYCNCRRT